jgi:hypothetical protein
MMVEAISGWGIGAGASAIQQNLPNTVNFDKTSTPWNYSQWVPDAVVMLIGPNDESLGEGGLVANSTGGAHKNSAALAAGAGAGVSGSRFIKQYTNLLDYFVGAYTHRGGAAPPEIISVCGGSLNGLDPCADIQTAQAAFNTAQKGGAGFHASYVTITKAHWSEINAKKGKSPYNGCDGHYNEKGHKVLLGDILPDVKKILGW